MLIMGAVALQMRYTKYSNHLMINLLYFVVLLLIATAPLRTWEKPLKLIIMEEKVII